jgi:hypothetical protein
MRYFTGKGGKVYAVGEPYQFEDVWLQDCGTGWDWRAPEGLQCWLPETLSFDVEDPVRAVEIHRSGRVGFNRCLTSVRASGTCYPVSLIGEGGWRLDIDAVTQDRPTLGGGEATQTATKIIGMSAVVDVTVEPTEQVLAWLEFGPGVFVGVGDARCGSAQIQVNFNDEGVSYEPR